MEKKKIRFIIIILFSLINHSLIAQPSGGPDGTGVNNIPPVSIGEKNINQLFIAPEVSQLLKVNFIPMSLYTGKLNLEIPLYEIKTGGISVPVSLKYNSEGIKIEEESSNVGTGWVLQAGGSVSKMVRDIEDNTAYLRLYSINSSSYAAKAVAYGSLTSPGNVAIDASKDLMPDLFITTAPGLNSKFYFSKDSSISSSISVTEIGNKGNKITAGNPYARVYDGDLKSLAWVGINKVFPYFNDSGRLNDIQGAVDNLFQNYPGNFSDYADFNITNPQGLNYKFKTSDINVAFPTGISSDIYYFGVPDPQKFFWAVRGFMMEKYNINKGTWHLDEITDTSNKKVNFEYLSFNSSNITKYPNTSNGGIVSLPNEGGTQNEFNGVSSGGAGSSESNNDYSFYTLNPLYHYVSKIKWDNGEVEFIYDTNRDDVLGKKALSRIKIKDKQLHVIKEYIFNYSYLSTGEAKRLKLDRIDVMEANQQKQLYELSYYEDNNLPSRKSFKKDFLGFYNNNNLSDDLPMMDYLPQLYFVRGRKNMSITPFNVNNSVLVPGGVRNIEANNYSSTGLLKFIKNRTGGYNEFTYESNAFRFYDQDILGGGSRISSQIIREGSSERKIRYKYTSENGYSSGSISNLPVFGGIGKIQTVNGKDIYHMGSRLRSSSNIELTDGAYVGYERVIEEEQGKGTTEYLYTSPKQFPNTYSTAYVPVGGLYNNQPLNKIINSSFFPGDVFMENDKTGQLISRKIFDNNSNLLSSESKQYLDKVFSSKNFNSTKQIIRGIQSGMMTYIYDVNIQLVNSINLLSSEEYIAYFNGKQIRNKNEYTYSNISNPFLSSEKNIDPENNVAEKIYRYSTDKGNQYLIDKNIVNIPIEVETKKNLKTLSKQETKYPPNQTIANNITAGLPLPLSILSTDLIGLETVELSYDKYDSKGNILQYTTREGLPTTMIWGYNQTLPIAKIIGATYAQVMQAFNLDGNSNSSYSQLEIVKKSDLDINHSSEEILISELKKFQSKDQLKDYQITIYAHDLLVGTKAKIGVNGFKQSYKYDSANRLNKILDHNDNFVKEYNYNYNDLPLTFYNSKKSQPFTTISCGIGTQPQSGTYTIPAGHYISTLSQDDADQKAQNDINANGQNWVNANYPCIPNFCSIDPAYNVSIYYSSFQEISPNHIKGILSLPVSNSTNWSGTFIGTLGSLCTPNSYKNISVSSGNGSGIISIAPNGGVTVWLSASSNSSSVTFYFEYDK